MQPFGWGEYENGAVRVQVRLEEGTVWLTQRQLAGLYGASAVVEVPEVVPLGAGRARDAPGLIERRLGDGASPRERRFRRRRRRSGGGPFCSKRF
jgi:hypothetical protein